MNALLIALTMSLTGPEGNVAADLAQLPLTMSFFGGEEAAAVDRLDLRSSACLAFELPTYAELVDVKSLAAPVSFDGLLSRPWMVAQPTETEESLAWMTNWEQR